jgi:HD-GYP domain-containing protein (c-di-GMP phosphodiesterase class II)
LVKFFKERRDKEIFNDGVVVYGDAKKFLRRNIGRESKQLLKGVIYQMEIFDSIVCIPSYFQNELLGILLLGRKKSGKGFAQDELDFFVALASDVAMAIRNAQLFAELQEELDKKHRLFIHTTVALAAAIDAKDHYTHGHTARVTALSLEIAKKLMQKNKKKFDDKFLENLHIAGLLHDIGKIGVSESILNKQGPLSPEERKKIEEHPLLGITILQPIKELEESITGVRYHHERYDGSGYPDGIKGNKIPTIAAIIAVADTYDAMMTDRPYRKGLSKEATMAEIKRVSGSQLVPQIANALIELYEEGGL